MRPPSFFLPTLVLALAACNDDTAGLPEPAPEGLACPLTERVRLASPPAGFTPANLYYALHRVGDHLLFTFDGPDDPARTYWHTSRCGGPVEAFTSLPPSTVLTDMANTDAGPVLYAIDPDGQVFLVDRLDVPGFDEPLAIPGLPAIRLVFPEFFPNSSRRYVPFSTTSRDGLGWSAAGIGGITRALFTHTGDPDIPALQVGAATVRTFPFDDHLLVHDDDGTVRRFDPFTGASEPQMTGVRHIAYLPGSTRAIWQELGDDQSERVFLRDLAAGTDVEIAVNDFAQQSWHRGDDGTSGDAGLWTWTDDGAFAAMKGPDDTLVAAVRTDTGAPLAIPDHIAYRRSLTRHIQLTLADPTDHVDGLWDPATGGLRIWYRGPVKPRVLRDDGASAEVLIPDLDDFRTGRLVRVDLATGTSTELLPRFSIYSGRLTDDLYLFRTPRRDVSLAMTELGQWQTTSMDLAFVDPTTQLYTPIAGEITAMAILPDEALYILDAHGDDPGVWAVPYPE